MLYNPSISSLPSLALSLLSSLPALPRPITCPHSTSTFGTRDHIPLLHHLPYALRPHPSSSTPTQFNPQHHPPPTPLDITPLHRHPSRRFSSSTLPPPPLAHTHTSSPTAPPRPSHVSPYPLPRPLSGPQPHPNLHLPYCLAPLPSSQHGSPHIWRAPPPPTSVHLTAQGSCLSLLHPFASLTLTPHLTQTNPPPPRLLPQPLTATTTPTNSPHSAYFPPPTFHPHMALISEFFSPQSIIQFTLADPPPTPSLLSAPPPP